VGTSGLFGPAVVALVGLCCAATTAHAVSGEAGDLSRLSIEELGAVQVTSVSKRSEPLGHAPSAIYVISHDDIIRSGATSIPEMLRLAPNLQVAQTSASKYVITARGFSGNNNAQSFTNKLLVLIDGRSVYTPLFSGVYWDMQDVMPVDIERIEVISGPGATLWGANAVNGVINIITRKSADTQGGVIGLSAGDRQRSAGLHYGGRLGENATWRAYARAIYDEQNRTATGAKAGDDWSRPQAGFRLDWSPSAASVVTVSGDAYRGDESQPGAADEIVRGANLLARLNHTLGDGSALQVQAYYDHTGRKTGGGGGSFRVDTYDLDLQHSFTFLNVHQVVWGGGLRASRYRINGSAGLQFDPPGRTLRLGNLFVQDSVALTAQATLTLGVKLEDDPYSGAAVLPNARLSVKPAEGLLLWAAASRAIRSPTPFDRDVVERVGGVTFLTGDADFQPEKLTAYEAGLRLEPAPHASLSVSTYYNVYDDLRTIEPTPGSFIPLRWDNQMRGHTYGLEAWAEYRVAPWWRLSGGFNLMAERLAFKPGGSGLLGPAQAGDDPRRQGQIRSSMDLGRAVTLDAGLRYVGALPSPAVASYVEADARLGWQVTERVRVAISGRNLLHDRHLEFPAPGANTIPRSVFLDLEWGF
jgi:iron complex outermembrane receptor protein